MREAKLQGDCLQLVKDGWWGRVVALNMHGGGYCNKGFPDILMLGCGKAVAVELKSPTSGYGVQADQRVWKRRLEAAGVAWYRADDLGGFGSIVRKEFGDGDEAQGRA